MKIIVVKDQEVKESRKCVHTLILRILELLEEREDKEYERRKQKEEDRYLLSSWTFLSIINFLSLPKIFLE